MSWKLFLACFLAAAVGAFVSSTGFLYAQSMQPRIAQPTTTPLIMPTSSPLPKPVLTEERPETLGPLEELLRKQKLGSPWVNPLKYAIRGAVKVGVPANTIVLLLLLPVVAAVIAAGRHIVGVRGFGIFLPAALSVVFVSTGPVVGIGLFLLIITISFSVRVLFHELNLRLQYLPRMALILWAVALGVLGILFAAPLIRRPEITNVSIFPVLILALLAEDFTRVQIGKSARTAVSLTTETLILSLVSFIFLTWQGLQRYVLLNPEIVLGGVVLFDFILGRFVGLRLLEIWRFRKLLRN